MAMHKVFWSEIARIWAQWMGIGLAAIPSGLILGVLLRYGINEKAALAIALAVGFATAVTFWFLIARWVVVKPVDWTTGISPNVISLDYAGAFVTVLCITLYSAQLQTGTMERSDTSSVIPHAISKL